MNESSHVPQFRARIGANHGYLIEGDVARIHADVEGLNDSRRERDWALQLWACDSPHTGGPLSGIMVAEAELTASEDATEPLGRLDIQAHARVPGGQRDYAMVLVLASGQHGHTQVHDFSNYPARQRFPAPHLDGSVGYQIESEILLITADGVRSPRDAGNLSGSLSLELWALSAPYQGGPFEGHLMGRVDLGRLAGQDALRAIAVQVPFAAPPEGRWDVVMMLREWAGPAGVITRDYVRFTVPYLVAGIASAQRAETELVAPDRSTTAAVVAPSRREDAAPAAVPAAEATPVSEPVAAVASPPAPIAQSVARATRTPAGVSVNHASAEQLAAVKGLSKTLARAIVKGRPYRSFEALLEVHGMGPKLLARLRPFLAP